MSSISIPIGIIWILSFDIPNSNASLYSIFEEIIIAWALLADVFKVMASYSW
tara:strand:- start:347 stop:502 length:156 start_codon:yes stop_codon:yes gene_type:complete